MSIQVTVKGNVGTDPELKFAKNETPYAIFSLAHTPRVKQGGEWIDGETIWFRVVTFGAKAEDLVDAISKGELVRVEGSMKLSTYQAKDGSTKQTWEINAREVDVLKRTEKKQEAVAPW